MRKTGLIVLKLTLMAIVTGGGIFTGHLWTTNNPSGGFGIGLCVLLWTLIYVTIDYFVTSAFGRSEVVTSFPGKGNHDLIFGATYRVLSCTRWDARYVVVLEDTQNRLWSCVLPEEPPQHFVYTKGDHPYTPVAASAHATPPTGGATSETATAS